MIDRRTRLYLADMLRYAELATGFVGGVSKEDFEANQEKQLATIRALEVIGEAAKNVPAEVRAQAPDVPWRQISGMRDKLIHHYFGVDLDAVWKVTQGGLPELISWMRVLLSTFDAGED